MQFLYMVVQFMQYMGREHTMIFRKLCLQEDWSIQYLLEGITT